MSSDYADFDLDIPGLRLRLVDVLKLSPRSMVLAYSVVHDLCQTLQPGCIPIYH